MNIIIQIALYYGNVPCKLGYHRYISTFYDVSNLDGSKGEERGSRPSIGKSQVALGFLKILVWTPFKKQLDYGSNCFSREVCTGLGEFMTKKKKKKKEKKSQKNRCPDRRNFLNPHMSKNEFQR